MFSGLIGEHTDREAAEAALALVLNELKIVGNQLHEARVREEAWLKSYTKAQIEAKVYVDKFRGRIEAGHNRPSAMPEAAIGFYALELNSAGWPCAWAERRSWAPGSSHAWVVELDNARAMDVDGIVRGHVPVSKQDLNYLKRFCFPDLNAVLDAWAKLQKNLDKDAARDGR